MFQFLLESCSGVATLSFRKYGLYCYASVMSQSYHVSHKEVSQLKLQKSVLEGKTIHIVMLHSKNIPQKLHEVCFRLIVLLPCLQIVLHVS